MALGLSIADKIFSRLKSASFKQALTIKSLTDIPARFATMRSVLPNKKSIDMIIKDLVPLKNSIVKVKLKNEEQPLIGYIGFTRGFNRDISISGDIYPCGVLYIVPDWENYILGNITTDERDFCISDIESLEILKNNIPVK